MPWHLSADLKYFRKTTMDKPIVMGRRTWESLGRPLPGRRNMVVSRNAELQLEGAEVFASLEAALQAVSDVDEVMIIGGGQLYREAMPLAGRLYRTRIRETFSDGDTWFPEIDETAWKLVSTDRHPADEKNPFDYDFEILERVA